MHHHSPISEQATLPLNGIAFQLYLQRHRLAPLDVALAAGVRYLTIWNIAHSLPVQHRHAVLVRQALFRLTGEPYTAPILVRQHQDQMLSARTAQPQERQRR